MPAITANTHAIRGARRVLWPDGIYPDRLPVALVLNVAQALADTWDEGALDHAAGDPNPYRDAKAGGEPDGS